MIGEINFYGVYLPSLLVVSLLALIATVPLRIILRRFGLYRVVWHPALFNLALFVIALGLSLSLTIRWAP